MDIIRISLCSARQGLRAITHTLGRGELISESELQRPASINGDESTTLCTLWLWQIPACGFPVQYIYPFGIRLTGGSKAESDLVPTKTGYIASMVHLGPGTLRLPSACISTSKELEPTVAVSRMTRSQVSGLRMCSPE